MAALRGPALSLAHVPLPANPDPWLTLREAAREVRVGYSTLRKAIDQKQLRAVRVNNARVWRLRRSWLDAWLEGDGGDPRY